LIPAFLLLPVLAAPQRLQGWHKLLPALALGVGLLNSLLILLFYSVGCWKNQAVLESQLRFLRGLPQPLEVHMPMFLSNRIWFLREGIAFQTTGEPPPRPRIQLLRTKTTVSLPADWEKQLNQASQARDWKKRGLVQEDQ